VPDVSPTQVLCAQRYVISATEAPWVLHSAAKPASACLPQVMRLASRQLSVLQSTCCISCIVTVFPQVVLVPVSLDGHDRGTAALLPSFSTGDPLTPPRLSEDLGINPVVGPDRFNVFNISQDKPGFAYVLVTRPQNQVNPQVHTCDDRQCNSFCKQQLLIPCTDSLYQHCAEAHSASIMRWRRKQNAACSASILHNSEDSADPLGFGLFCTVQQCSIGCIKVVIMLSNAMCSCGTVACAGACRYSHALHTHPRCQQVPRHTPANSSVRHIPHGAAT
jgi:hypothetical protein